MQVNMHQAKTQLLRLGRLAWEGEQVVIAKAGELHLRLEPYKMSRSASMSSRHFHWPSPKVPSKQLMTKVNYR